MGDVSTPAITSFLAGIPDFLYAGQRVGGKVRIKSTTVAWVAATGDIYQLFRIRSSDYVIKLMAGASANVSAADGTAKIGVQRYQFGGDPYAIPGATYANFTPAEIFCPVAPDIGFDGILTRPASVSQAGNSGPDEHRELWVKPIWERIGLSEDPHEDYVVTWEMANAIGNTGTALFQMFYVQGN